VYENFAGKPPFPDDYAVEQLSSAPGSGNVQDDNYTLEYSFNGRQEKAPALIASGMLCSGL
jgi:hypothetical protein